MTVFARPARAFTTGLLLAATILAWPAPATAEAPRALVLQELCGYYKSQARGQSLYHYTTEALWACEMLAARRAAGMPLSDRMRAVAFALEQFREAMTEERAARYPRTGGPGVPLRVARERTSEMVAEESGMLAALEAVRSGF